VLRNVTYQRLPLRFFLGLDRRRANSIILQSRRWQGLCVVTGEISKFTRHSNCTSRARWASWWSSSPSVRSSPLAAWTHRRLPAPACFIPGFAGIWRQRASAASKSAPSMVVHRPSPQDMWERLLRVAVSPNAQPFCRCWGLRVRSRTWRRYPAWDAQKNTGSMGSGPGLYWCTSPDFSPTASLTGVEPACGCLL
jgi:hypothetical protein